MAEHRAVHHVMLPLLLGFLLIAWAGTGADARPTCEREALAARIARACEHDGAPPTTPCCIAVVASVKLGGGVPCLCRVAAQPQVVLARLNASQLLALYAACGGRLSMRSGGAHLCTPGRGGRLLAAQPQCDSPELSDQLVRHCEVGAKMPSPTCCAAVLSTVDSPDRGCLCTVSEKGDFLLSSYLSVSFVWEVYQDCGGTRDAIPEDTTDCRHAPPPPPPPQRPRAKAPSPTPSPPCAPHYSLFEVIAVGFAVIVGGGVGVGVVLIFYCCRPSSSSAGAEVSAPASAGCGGDDQMLLPEEEERLPAAVRPGRARRLRAAIRGPAAVVPPRSPVPVAPIPPATTPPQRSCARRRPRPSWPAAGTEAGSPPRRSSYST